MFIFGFIIYFGSLNLTHNVPQLGDGAKFVTTYFPLKIDIIAKRKRDFTTNFALLPNCCCRLFLIYFTTFNT